MKKTSNKGFSLVELIVVIAIMGVLMVVLAPQYLKYVEKSRLQKDNSAIAEIAENIKIAVADEEIAKEVRTASGSKAEVKLTGGTALAYSASKLDTELKSILGDKVELNSNTYSGKTVVISVELKNGIFVVSGNGLIYTPGSTTTTSVQF